MSWRWLLYDYADPDLPVTWKQRMRAVWRPVSIRHLPRGAMRGRIWFALCVIGVGVIAMFVWLWLLTAATASIAFGHLLLWIALVVSAIWFTSALAYGVFCRREHYLRLRLEGFDLCTRCGYWLRGLDESVTHCPECGAAREPMPEVKS